MAAEARIHVCVGPFNTKKNVAPVSESISGLPKKKFRDSKAAGRSERQRLCLRPPIPAAFSTHPLPTRTPSPTQKAYRRSAAAKVAKPTWLPHANFTICNGISRLVMRPAKNRSTTQCSTKILRQYRSQLQTKATGSRWTSNLGERISRPERDVRQTSPSNAEESEVAARMFCEDFTAQCRVCDDPDMSSSSQIVTRKKSLDLWGVEAKVCVFWPYGGR